MTPQNFSLDNNTEDPNDRLLVNAETTDSSDEPTEGRANSLMNISLRRGREKCNGKEVRGKGKKKKFGAREVSKSADNLVTTSREFALVLRSKDKGLMTILECVNDLLFMGLVVSGDELHLITQWFFMHSDN
ncbi:Hypothetical predicted protein [Olea europaea subsp. europaea]|uniref:Uncharacterized protein n=1 Tax=Olea europaea subsp. europaea TaxID=158383 RepID=A0A8S0RYW8_OLEEU|nr:Hypothetical predicted protein [Olea europaea subsp. europaea]